MHDALRLLREKQAESRLKNPHALLAEELQHRRGEPWNKDAFIFNNNNL